MVLSFCNQVLNLTLDWTGGKIFFYQGKVNPSPATKIMHLKMSSAAYKCLHQGL